MSASDLLADLERTRAVELSHPMETGMPNDPSHPAFLLAPYYRLGDSRLPGGYSGSNELLIMSGHSGTHLDALCHVSRHGVVYGGRSHADAQDGIRGIVEHAVDGVAPILRRGVLLDVAAYHGVDRLAPGSAITASDLRECAYERQVEVRDGDCVVVRTGQGSLWGDPPQYLASRGEGLPGITLEAAKWLQERKVFLAGSDTSVFEHAPAGLGTFPVHMYLLATHGVFIVENLALEELAATGWTEFVFLALPLRIVGASGSPVRAIAVGGE
jgi:kynurenine formamidase